MKSFKKVCVQTITYVDHAEKEKTVENIILPVFLCKKQTFNLELVMIHQPSYT